MDATRGEKGRGPTDPIVLSPCLISTLSVKTLVSRQNFSPILARAWPVHIAHCDRNGYCIGG